MLIGEDKINRDDGGNGAGALNYRLDLLSVCSHHGVGLR
jgi:hypothetical protein